MKTMILAGLGLLLCCTAWPTVEAQQPKTSPIAQIMADKLKNAQFILEGMALGDYEKIGRGADRLVQLSKTAEWFVHKTAKYELHSNEFRRAAENISQRAAAKNLDGVALAYFDLTLTCVRCHKYVREIRDARGPGSPPAVARHD